MNSDSIFLIGDSHEVCEDYAYNKDYIEAKTSYAVLSDGCSGSNNTDVGARILTHSSLEEPKFNEIIQRADFITDNLGISNTCLDATLLMLMVEKNADASYLSSFIAGDGYIAIKSPNELVIYEGHAPNGYPYYLSYSLDKERKNNYVNSNGIPSITKYLISKNDEVQLSELQLNEKGFFSLRRPFDSQTTFAVFSDGISSFLNDKKEQINPIEVIKELMNFKNFKGEFVKRRVKSFLKTAKKNGWTHHDDLSMAAIHIEE